MSVMFQTEIIAYCWKNFLYYSNNTQGENQMGALKKPKTIGLVYISNTSVLLPVSKQLAKDYV